MSGSRTAVYNFSMCSVDNSLRLKTFSLSAVTYTKVKPSIAGVNMKQSAHPGDWSSVPSLTTRVERRGGREEGRRGEGEEGYIIMCFMPRASNEGYCKATYRERTVSESSSEPRTGDSHPVGDERSPFTTWSSALSAFCN